MVLLRVFMLRAGVVLFTIAGCDVGEVPLGGGGADADNVALCADRQAVNPAYKHIGALDTKAGQGCVAVGCHLPGQTGAGAPSFTAAGTIYKADKVTPNAGALVRIKSGGNVLKAVADDAGNFSFQLAITYPATTEGTACPDLTPMVGQITTGPGVGGNCNSSGCHGAGSTQGPIKFGN
jgi:hypothetical protein